MANKYATNTSSKKKKTALIVWAVGCLGLLGLENFYVGKIKNGLIHFVLGFFASFLVFILLKGESDEVVLGVALWAICAVPNLVKLLLGTFRDNVGEPLRQ